MVKQIIKFNYWTNLMKCHDGNVGGTAIISMTDDEALAFTSAIADAVNSNDILKYFSENLSTELSDAIASAIKRDFQRVMAKDAIDMIGKDAFSAEMTDEEYESMTEDQLIDLLVSETPAVDEEYKIVDIKITNN